MQKRRTLSYATVFNGNPWFSNEYACLFIYTLFQTAEQFLQSAEKNAGFPLLALTLIVKEDADPNIRFAAALLLKNFVKRHWSVVSDSASLFTHST